MREIRITQQLPKELRNSSPLQLQGSTEGKKQFLWKDAFLFQILQGSIYISTVTNFYHNFVSLSTSISSMKRCYNQVKTPQAGHWHFVFTWIHPFYHYLPSHVRPTANMAFRVNLLHLIPAVLFLPLSSVERAEVQLWRFNSLRPAGCE